MDELFFDMIFKRKSFHLFRGTGEEMISAEELDGIRKVFEGVRILDEGIRIGMRICPAEKTNCRRGQEYCMLLYSEKKGDYLRNIGYVGEQMDLYLASKDIGSLWYGMGKVDEKQYQGLDFVIMIAMKKVPGEKFRKDMFKSKRKAIDDIWSGDRLGNVADIVRFAPSACNTQPWAVENCEGRLSVYRYRKTGKRGIMPANQVVYYNRIDMGIFLMFLEVCLHHEKMEFERELFHDKGGDAEKTLTAVYRLV